MFYLLLIYLCTGGVSKHFFWMRWDLAECGWDLAECGWELAELWMRSGRVWMISRRVWIRSGRVWMRSCWVVWASDSQCRSRNWPGFDPSIHRHSGIWGAADETVLNKVLKNQKKKSPALFFISLWEEELSSPPSISLSGHSEFTLSRWGRERVASGT